MPRGLAENKLRPRGEKMWYIPTGYREYVARAEVVRRADEVRGFVVKDWRWIVERTAR